MALAYEYNIDVIKINDPFLIAKDGKLIFKIEKNNINWKISQNILPNKLFLKFCIRFIHIYYYLSPYKKSYKIGSKNNIPNFILAKKLRKNFSIRNLIIKSKKNNIALSGWGLRDWKLVLKHKSLIVKNLITGINNSICFEKYNWKDFLLVHIRRSDFLEIEKYKELNFADEIWLKSILKLCSKKNINKVVIFSDVIVNQFLITSLKDNGLNVDVPEIGNKNSDFLDLFFSCIYRSAFVLCNASTLVLSISFLFHERIYLPSMKKGFQEILLNEAHNSFPTSLNWN